jgi:hypothetical protein
VREPIDDYYCKVNGIMTCMMLKLVPGVKDSAPLQLQAGGEGAFGLTIPDVEVPVAHVYFNPPRIMVSSM